jgi:type III secretory pathway component EscV
MAFGVSRSSIALAAVAALSVLLMALPLPGLPVDALVGANLLAAATLLLLAVGAARPLALQAYPALLLVAAVLRLSVAVAAARLALASDGSAGLRLVAGAVLQGSVAAAAVVLAGLGVVHHLVVARGAERIAEVAARFALDALPGRQLGIDADLRAGALDVTSARRAREDLAREGQMFAALDGAMKFVRGEAVALLAIVAVVLVGVALAGIARGAPVAAAARRAALLAAAVGVTAALPALIAALAAGILASRAGAAEPHGLGGALVRQLREAMGTGRRDEARMVVEVAPGARNTVQRVERAAAVVTDDLGLPPASVTVVERQGVRGCRVLLDGASLWDGEDGALDGLDRALRHNAGALVGVEETQRLLDDLGATHPALVRETVPKLVSTALLADVLRRLVREGVPIRPLREVLEAIAQRPAEARAADLCEHVRAARARTLTHRFCPAGRAAAIVVDPEVEDTVRDAIRGDMPSLDPEIARDITAAVRRHADGAGDSRVVLCAADVRRHLRGLLENDFPDLPVLSYGELLPRVGIDEVGRISMGGPA